MTLFYQRDSVSRFIRQKIMFNVWPIDDFRESHKIVDIRQHPWPYMYFYGLFAHKLAHFFDVVHGTRHDFFMNEYKIESITRWINLLRRKGFDPAALESGPYGEQFLKNVVL